MRRASTLALAISAAAGFSACHSGSQQEGTLTRAQLLDPQACAGCHQEQFADWAGSMHAYSSNDPVMRAMNARGQRETNGQLGTFCVNCHAPMAVREGATKDGLNLDQLPSHLKGITCFFCHSVESVNGTHDNPLKLATDGVLRGAFSDPLVNGRPHGAAYSPLLDRNRAESGTTCGACHDIVNGHGAAIERTFSEWKDSAFKEPIVGSTCGGCHMPQSTTDKPVANVPGAPLRRSHSHTMPAIDVALTPFPDRERQKAQVQALLDTSLQTAICVQQFGSTGQVSVIMDNVAAGHSFPSGSEQDRRAWVELIAYQGSTVLFQTGVVPLGTPSTSAANDTDRWLLRDCMFDESGKEVHMFWEATSFETNGLPAKPTFDVTSPDFYQTHKYRYFPKDGTPMPMPDRVTLQVHFEPVGLEVVDDLIRSGDLDPSVRNTLANLKVGAPLEWTPVTATATYLDRNTGQTVKCATNTNINVAADRFPAPTRSKCAP